MSPEPFSSEPALPEGTLPEGTSPLPHGQESWRQIECQLDELTALGQTSIEPAEFYRALLARVATSLEAPSGVVWHLDGARKRRIAEYLVGSDTALAARDSSQQSITSHVPLDDGGEYQIELLLDANLPESGALSVLNIFRDVAVEYHRAHELQTLRAAQRTRKGLEEVSLRLHASLDRTATAYAIANDGRHWLGCDRLSVVELRGRRAKVLAVSGVDEIDYRAEELQRLTRLGTRAAQMGEALEWSAGDSTELPPELSDALEAYVDRAHAVQLAIVPLTRPSPDKNARTRDLLGLLVAERFTNTNDSPPLLKPLSALAPHAASSLGAALTHHRVPLLKSQMAIGKVFNKVRQRPAGMLLGAALVIGLLTAILFIPAEFTVEATGTLEPQWQRNLFAPSDGVVDDLLVAHGQSVSPQERLLQLRNPELALEFSRIAGEAQTAQARLAAVRAQRTRPRDQQTTQQNDRQLAAEEEQLRAQITGLDAEQDLLQTAIKELTITSPLDGIVLTWEPEHRLLNRPVKRGQKLLTVADPHGPWVLELHVPDDEIGPVLAARAKNPEVRVAFLLGSDAATTHYGTIQSITQSSESIGGEPASVTVTAILDEPPAVESLAGASVSARIQCGQRSLGYVWLHDLIDTVRKKLLF